MTNVLPLPVALRAGEMQLRPPLARLNRFTERLSITERFPVLLVPGTPESGAGRREEAWLRHLPRFLRVDVPEPDHQDLDHLSRAIVETAVTFAEPVIVLAHGFGCLATVQASSLQSHVIAGAVLISPVDPAGFRSASRLAKVTPDFPTVLALRKNGSSINPVRAQELAYNWGSDLISFGVPTDTRSPTGYAGWKVGLDLLEHLCRRVVGGLGSDVLTMT